MRLTLDWVQLVALLGAVQGLLLTGVLVVQRKNRTANGLLAVLIATFTIFLASTVYYSTGIVRRFPHFFGIGYLMPWVFGPLVYLYAVAASDRYRRFDAKWFIHFVPVAVSIVAMSPYYLLSGAEKLALMDQWLRGSAPQFIRTIDPLKYLSGIGYSIVTVVYLRRHRRLIENSYSNIARVNLRWLNILTISAFGIWMLATTLKLGNVSGTLRDEHIALAMAVLVYAIGYFGLRQPEILRYETAEHPVPASLGPPTLSTAPPPSEPSEAVSVRYARSGLTDSEAMQLKDALLKVMEFSCPWKDSELTLADLAERLNTSPHKLSEVLNAEIGQTFYDFVNGYRVREVQRRIKAGDARALKMLALAMDAGFASKSTFNQVFKKHTNLTPSDFRQAVEA